MSYAIGSYSLGQQDSFVAGPINGISTLKRDVQISARNATEAYGTGLSYNHGEFRDLLRRFKNDPDRMKDTELSPEQVRNFVIGVISETAGAVARAEQLSGLRVRGSAQLEENRRGQAELIGSARIMLDGCNTMLGVAVPVRGSRSVSGLPGLGEPISLSIIIAVAIVAVIVGVAAVAAIALVADAMNRMIQARATAKRICEEAEGGCTADQYSAIVERLRLGPFDALARGSEAALRSAGSGIATTVILAGAGVVTLGGLWFLFGTKAGRRTLDGMRRKKGAAS